MSSISIQKISRHFTIEINDIASDKSISHRSVLFALLAKDTCKISNFLRGEDTLNTLKIAQYLGASVQDDGQCIIITPPDEIEEPSEILDCGNSGTGIRLLCGLLAGRDSKMFILTGDSSIRSRPMGRIIAPLNSNGANILGRQENTLAPIVIKGVKPKSFHYESLISSAQVKSALLFYGLFAKENSSIVEPSLSRDHTEIMLQKLGAKVSTINADKTTIHLEPMSGKLDSFSLVVPSDPSSGFFFAVAACLIPDANITLKNILLNDTRIEAYKVLQKMGADIEFRVTSEAFEQVGDIIISHAPLRAIEVSENIAWLIDEIPALAIAFCVAEGKSKIKNAKELRAKESDRIASVVKNLRLFNVEVLEYEDGFEVLGKELQEWQKNDFSHITVQSYDDHRIAMSFAVLGLLCGVSIQNTQCVATSFPNFFPLLESLNK